MTYFSCPFCGNNFFVTPEILTCNTVSFTQRKSIFLTEPSSIRIDMYKCPNCHEFTVYAKGVGSSVEDVDVFIRPKTPVIIFPDCVPMSIQQDYKEACAIIDLSPKAAATLARRCLQSIIRDVWNVNENRLADAILQLKDRIPPDEWAAVDAVRQLGNIGAHMEKDVNLIIEIEPHEAEKILELVAILIQDWYVMRHEKENIINDVSQIAHKKQILRNKNRN